MRRLLKNPDKRMIADYLRTAQHAAMYRGTPRHPLYPFPVVTAFRIANSESGYWYRNARIRSVGVAWWTDRRGDKHVAFHGDCRRAGLSKFPPGKDALPMVFTTVDDVRHLGGFVGAYANLPAEFRDAIKSKPADPLTWLVAADWLEENGHDARAIRSFFAEPQTT